MTNLNEVPWIGSWNRKRARVEKLVKSEQNCSLINGNVSVLIS